MKPGIPLFWHVCDNFGDALAPWLVKQITGRDARYVSPYMETNEVPYLVTGSILGSSLSRGFVWGAGSAHARDLDAFPPPTSVLSVVATRGPMSKAIVERAGHAPRAHGDPGLLLPRFYSPEITLARDVGVFCSWINEHEVPSGVPYYGSMTASTVLYIDNMLACDVVLAGCLHALIAAIAYGKRVTWVRFPTPLLGDGFKFADFFASLGLEGQEPHMIETAEDVAAAVRRATVFDPPNTDGLLACCPFA